jgi:hypothetical protein
MATTVLDLNFVLEYEVSLCQFAFKILEDQEDAKDFIN